MYYLGFSSPQFFYCVVRFLPWVRLATCPKTAVASHCFLKIILLAHPITHTWLCRMLVLVLILWNWLYMLACFLFYTCFCWYQLFNTICGICFSNGCVWTCFLFTCLYCCQYPIKYCEHCVAIAMGVIGLCMKGIRWECQCTPAKLSATAVCKNTTTKASHNIGFISTLEPSVTSSYKGYHTAVLLVLDASDSCTSTDVNRPKCSQW